MSVTREELDKTAQEYHLQDVLEDKHIEGACQEYSFTWVFDRLKPHQHVLEMGYGDGLFSAALHNRNISFSIVEGALSLVQEVQKRYPEVKIYHELFEAFTPAEQYDVILATHVLEHVDEPVTLLKSMKAWLKPGGKIIVIVPNKDSIHRRLAVKMGLQPRLDTLGQRDLLVGHQRVYGLDTLRQDLEEAGYCVNQQTGFFLKVLPNSMMKGYSPELIKALNEISEDLAPDLLANIGVEASIA